MVWVPYLFSVFWALSHGTWCVCVAGVGDGEASGMVSDVLAAAAEAPHQYQIPDGGGGYTAPLDPPPPALLSLSSDSAGFNLHV